MPSLTFHVNNFDASYSDPVADPTLIEHTAGSGLGFYGGGFGISVPVGQYQETTFVTNANGTDEGVKCNNIQYTTTSGAIDNGGSAITNSGLPNFYAPLRITFEHDEAVRVQNCKLRIFDRNDISKQASGVTTQVYEIRHPHPIAIADSDRGPLSQRGIAEHGWQEFDPEDPMSDMTLTPSPGSGGLNTEPGDPLPASFGGYDNHTSKEGAQHETTQHDWFIALSASPDSIGSKTDYALYMSLEYI